MIQKYQADDTKEFMTGGGNYSFANVPPGEVTLKVDYTGYAATPATVRVHAGQSGGRSFSRRALVAAQHRLGDPPAQRPRLERAGEFQESGDRRRVSQRQQLAFLPGFLQRTGVYMNYTRTLPSARRGGVAPHHVKGGLNFRYHRFGLGFNASWYPDTPRNNVNQYRREYKSIALNADFKLTARTSLFLIGKNITNEVEVEAETRPGGLDWDRQYSHYGSIWTLGLRGSF